MFFQINRKISLLLILLAGAGILAFYFLTYFPSGSQDVPNPSSPTQNQDNTPKLLSTETEIIARNLRVPWGMVSLPSGEILATERPGSLRVIQGEEVREIKVPGVVQRGEGGLLGITLHPDYSSNQLIYLYFTSQSGGRTFNQVARYNFNGRTLTNPRVIISNLPGGTNHNGGYIAFGPDEKLYITIGDVGIESLAQDTNSLAGKILRLEEDGSVPADNPFRNAVYSYGHRNPQGLAWDDQGNLWATEHGRSGLQSGLDELNLIVKGGNYGWPLIEGDESRSGMQTPRLHSGATKTWAPAALVFVDKTLYFTGLCGETLYEVKLDSAGGVEPPKEHFEGQFGRLRALALGKDGELYFSTSNQDGRGYVQSGDDKILKVKRD